MQRKPEWPNLLLLAALMLGGAAFFGPATYMGLGRPSERAWGLVKTVYFGAFAGCLLYFAITRLGRYLD